MKTLLRFDENGLWLAGVRIARLATSSAVSATDQPSPFTPEQPVSGGEAAVEGAAA